MPHPRGGWCSALRLWTWDHPEDRVTSQIGICLWRQHGMNIQAQHLVDAIVDAGDRGEITRKLEPWVGEKGPMQWQW